MSWAARRTTTLKEDKVYCLLRVFMSLIYGEREAYATLRLGEEIWRRQDGQGTERLRDLIGTLSLRQMHFSSKVCWPCPKAGSCANTKQTTETRRFLQTSVGTND